jgi:hypothetical protein
MNLDLAFGTTQFTEFGQHSLDKFRMRSVPHWGWIFPHKTQSHQKTTC